MAASLRATATARQREAPGRATGFIPKPFAEPELPAEAAAVLQRRPAPVDHPA